MDDVNGDTTRKEHIQDVAGGSGQDVKSDLKDGHWTVYIIRILQ